MLPSLDSRLWDCRWGGSMARIRPGPSPSLSTPHLKEKCEGRLGCCSPSSKKTLRKSLIKSAQPAQGRGERPPRLQPARELNYLFGTA
ncbi:hypothetical protein TWF173_002833 [Orbilia oligospora]|nr:hypothetical protein TWF173_002833 [Orbilia oligospora]